MKINLHVVLQLYPIEDTGLFYYYLSFRPYISVFHACPIPLDSEAVGTRDLFPTQKVLLTSLCLYLIVLF